MAGKTRRFIVVVLNERNNYGFDEHTLPPLIALMDSASPDARHWRHTSVIGFFLTSSEALARVQHLIQQLEHLRITDSLFASLGIGLAEGQMVADFTWLGRVREEMPPLGDTANRASHSAQFPDAYKPILQSLCDEFNRRA